MMPYYFQEYIYIYIYIYIYGTRLNHLSMDNIVVVKVVITAWHRGGGHKCLYRQSYADYVGQPVPSRTWTMRIACYGVGLSESVG